MEGSLSFNYLVIHFLSNDIYDLIRRTSLAVSFFDGRIVFVELSNLKLGLTSLILPTRSFQCWLLGSSYINIVV